MGILIFDQYTLLHFATGVIAYFVGMRLGMWLLLHAIFEFTENTEIGMRFINEYMTWWPGGKPHADSMINGLGDTIASIVGWLVASKLDSVGKEKKWYE